LRSAQIDRIEAICPALEAISLLRAVAGVSRSGFQGSGANPEATILKPPKQQSRTTILSHLLRYPLRGAQAFSY
jgi:hypothetical protein